MVKFLTDQNLLTPKEKLQENIIFFLFVGLFFLEPLMILFNDFLGTYRVKAIYKLGLLVLLYILSIGNKYNKTAIGLFCTLLLCFLIGQLFLPQGFSVLKGDFLNEIKTGDIYITAKYLYVFVFITAYEGLSRGKTLTKRLIKLFVWFMSFNSIIIIIGLLTKWEFLKTYPNSSRFGYLGVIEMAGEAIHLFTLSITIVYVKYLNSKSNGLLLILLISCSLIIGKKAIIIYLFLLAIIHLIYFNKKIILFSLLFVTLILILFFNTLLINLFLKIFPFWEGLYENEGVLSVVLSKRDYLLNSALNYIDHNWTFLNYIFGGIDFFNFRSEFGFFDLFLAFGLIGLTVYLIFLHKYFLSSQTLLVKALFLNILIIEAFSGGLFINVVPMVLFYLIAKYFKENESII